MNNESTPEELIAWVHHKVRRGKTYVVQDMEDNVVLMADRLQELVDEIKSLKSQMDKAYSILGDSFEKARTIEMSKIDIEEAMEALEEK